MLEQIKLLLGITDNSKDELITLLIEMAINEVINYTRTDDISGCDNIIMDIVIWKYNRLGSEGVSSENYSGVSFNYLSDYPESLLKQLKGLRKLVMI